MAYLASAGHERSPGERRVFEVWVLETIENVWTEFAASSSNSADGRSRRRLSPTLFPGAAGAARLEAERRPTWRGCSRTPWDFRRQKSSAAFWA